MSTVEGGLNIVTDNLILCLDAANSKSYPGSGTAWTDLSKNSNNGTLTNGPTFDSGNLGNGSSNQGATSPLSYTNQLIYVVGTIDTTTNNIIKIYVNGDLKASTPTIYPNMSISTSPVIIGGNAQSGFPGYMGGNIYNVSIYSQTLTAAEILQNYNTTKSRFGIS